MERLDVGVVGASGYSGELLARLLLRHPGVRLAAVTSRKLAGQRLGEVVPALREVAGDLAFTASEPGEVAASPIPVWFLALPHGVAAEYARPLVAAGKRVLDLSADFRLGSPALYAEYYKHEHPAPELLPLARYVIPELAAAGWESAPLIACPGCYPTSVQVPLVPLARAGLVARTGAQVFSVSGVTGAGRKAEEYYSFGERAESVQAYGAPKHRHLAEMEEQLGLAAGHPVVLQFTPHLVPMRRGIATTIYLPDAGRTLDEVYALWRAAYAGARFVHLLPSGKFPDTAWVTGTNRVEIAAVHDPRTRQFVLTSVIDNLMKGASGQAVQLLNRLQGWDEAAGLV